MATYRAGAYGPNPNAGVNVNADHGWGGYAWPAGVPASLLGTATYRGVSSIVRKELVELYQLAYAIAREKHGYTIWTKNPNGNGEPWGPWGYENRAISGSNTASNHSKGKANDWNAPFNGYANGFASIVSDFPPAMVADLESIGLCWGGRYGDAMHWEYGYAPGDVAGHVAKARTILGGAIVPPEPAKEWDELATEAQIRAIVADEVAKQGKTTRDYVNQILRDRTKGSQSIYDEGRYNTQDVIIPALNNLRDLLIAPEFQGPGHTIRDEVQWSAKNQVIPAITGEPPAPDVPATPATYTVVSGDTLSGIAAKTGKSVADLSTWNNIADPNSINVGQVLRLGP